MAAAQEITKHYSGQAESIFYPGNHTYYVNDEGFEFKGKKYHYKKKRAGGATSVTGVMDKGKGLQMWPMWEMSKFLRHHFNTTTMREMLETDAPTLDDLLKRGRDAHMVKSDRGKSVGTDAHAWVEKYFKAMWAEQNNGGGFDYPDVPTVPELVTTMQEAYVALINAAQPKDWDEYKKLAKKLMDDAEVQEAIWTEARMLRSSIDAFLEWVKIHDIVVIGVEETVYSRIESSFYLDEPVPQCGKFDQVLKITCSAKCGHCYTNRVGQPSQETFTATYLVDFKTTNTSSDFVMGIYPEYLPQCGVYDLGYTEEFPDREVDGHLILNASKKDGTFAAYFSLDRRRNREWARHLIAVKENLWSGRREITEAGKAHEEYLKQQTAKAAKAVKPAGEAAA